MFAGLSPAARCVWGKSERESDEWLPLWRHMADSGAVAGRLWDEWVPEGVKGLISAGLPERDADGERLVRFLATAHDIGKATPAFACQVDGLAAVMAGRGLAMRQAKAYGPGRGRLAPHGLAGQLLLEEWLEERYGFVGREAGQFAVVLGGHHGVPPEVAAIDALRGQPHLLRGEGAEGLWREVQFELLDACAEFAGVSERLADWQRVRLPQPVQVLLSGLVIVADWIASSPDLFPYDPDSWQRGAEGDRLERAWAGLDLLPPWQPDEPKLTAEELFAARFELPPHARIRPVQAEAVRLAREMPTPGLLVIEAPMGEGKTEAALAAAEILAARSGAGGVLIALPTRATSDAMFVRLLKWLNHLPTEDGANGRLSVALAHAKAGLQEDWRGMLRAGKRTIAAVDPESAANSTTRQGGHADAPAELHAHRWLSGSKRRLLASFAVGTVDQVLFAALKARHLALRHLALAGKVVVIDEVHAYDAYMNRYLDRALEWLAAYRVPVVLLSATLPAERRRELVEAYTGALPDDLPGPEDDAYPLLCAAAPGTDTLTAFPSAASDRRTEVLLEPLDDDLDALADRLTAELTDGGCALVVRNTVARVLEAADLLRERFGAEAVTVAHSRFLAVDRAAKDADLRDRFGPDGTTRPAGPHIVVASQVVEQSLDIDFDLLVTDLAPIDLLLQRIGRLHRHPRTRPARLAQARCLVTGVTDWAAEPPMPAKGSVKVYQGEHTLYRALAVLRPHLTTGTPVVLPDDIGRLVQAGYASSAAGPESWAGAMDEARAAYDTQLSDKEQRAGAFLLRPPGRAGRPLLGWLSAHPGDADDTSAGRALVRDSGDSLEVLVVQRQSDGALRTVPWLTEGRGGLGLPEHSAPSARAAEAVAACSLALPSFPFAQPWAIDRTIRELEQSLVPAWQSKECHWLAGELILALDEDDHAELAGYELRYHPDDGLRHTKLQEAQNPTGTTDDAPRSQP